MQKKNYNKDLEVYSRIASSLMSSSERKGGKEKKSINQNDQEKLFLWIEEAISDLFVGRKKARERYAGRK